MKTFFAVLGLLLAAPSGALAATLYVSATSPSPQPGYTGWATAAQTIQDAIDAARDGDTVLVNDGVYAVGGRSVADEETGLVIMSRAAIDRAITLKSVNGPEVTVIDGVYTARGVYVGHRVVLSGFTLTRGTAEFDLGGGVWCEADGVVTNCAISGNDAEFGGGAYGGTLYNCRLTNNDALRSAGGAEGATLYNCAIAGNSASRRGGGVEECTLYNCTLTGNSGGDVAGGGAFVSTLYNCTLTGNSSEDGGGASSSTLYNCTLKNNQAFRNGGGADYSILYKCTLIGNFTDAPGGGTFGGLLYNCLMISNSASAGGGAAGGTLYNCALIGNSADFGGGGAEEATLYNCALIGNSALSYYSIDGGGVLYPYGFGGGAQGCTLYNCTLAANNAGSAGGGVVGCAVSNSIVYYNSAPTGPNYDDSTFDGPNSFDHSCTTPLPSSGVGNTAQEPGFVDFAGGNYRLLITSPCINAGINQDWMVGATDLDGNPRISWGTVDMGAYEFLLPSSGPWKNHGQYVSTVAQVADQLLARGLITKAQKDAAVSAAAHSDTGKRK
jgi:hypothetical protein